MLFLLLLTVVVAESNHDYWKLQEPLTVGRTLIVQAKTSNSAQFGLVNQESGFLPGIVMLNTNRPECVCSFKAQNRTNAVCAVDLVQCPWKDSKMAFRIRNTNYRLKLYYMYNRTVFQDINLNQWHCNGTLRQSREVISDAMASASHAVFHGRMEATELRTVGGNYDIPFTTHFSQLQLGDEIRIFLDFKKASNYNWTVDLLDCKNEIQRRIVLFNKDGQGAFIDGTGRRPIEGTAIYLTIKNTRVKEDKMPGGGHALETRLNYRMNQRRHSSSPWKVTKLQIGRVFNKHDKKLKVLKALELHQVEIKRYGAQ